MPIVKTESDIFLMYILPAVSYMKCALPGYPVLIIVMVLRVVCYSHLPVFLHVFAAELISIQPTAGNPFCISNLPSSTRKKPAFLSGADGVE